jgi:hypothetical protein
MVPSFDPSYAAGAYISACSITGIKEWTIPQPAQWDIIFFRIRNYVVWVRIFGG